MPKSIQDWIREGEELHTAAVHELEQLDHQIADLEEKRAAKLAEVSQIAGIIGKPTPAPTAVIVDAGPARRPIITATEEHVGPAVHTSSATIARALAGKGLGR